LIGGFAVGGIVLMPGAVLTMTYLFGRLHMNGNYSFIPVYALALGLGFWAIVLARARVDFSSGFVAGAAAGLLGLSALCNALLSGLGTMH
jgi:hypothetical protein